MPSDCFGALMRHHAWMVRRLLDTAQRLTPAELEADALSHGSVLATLRHVADVDQSWGRVARGELPDEVSTIDAALTDLPSLRAFWCTEIDALETFTASLTPAQLDVEVRPPWKQHGYRVWQILTHVSNHSAEHGNEIGWRLTALGHSPGELAFMGFVDLERRGAV